MAEKKYTDVTCTEVTCFANCDGYCQCLTDNNFGEKKCPFFQEKDVYAEKQAKFEEQKAEKAEETE